MFLNRGRIGFSVERKEKLVPIVVLALGKDTAPGVGIRIESFPFSQFQDENRLDFSFYIPMYCLRTLAVNTLDKVDKAERKFSSRAARGVRQSKTFF